MWSADVNAPEDVEPALASAISWQAQAFMIFNASPAIGNARQRIADFALQNQIPLAGGSKQTVQDGGLPIYDASNRGQGYSAAALVDKILKRSSPSDLPVEQPSVFELVINQTTAR